MSRSLLTTDIRSMADGSSPDEYEDFESAGDLRSWLDVEQKHVYLAMERRIQEAKNLVEAYTAGKLTPTEAREKFAAYATRWPNRLCLDENLEIEIETEVTGLEPNPKGRTPYRPRKGSIQHVLKDVDPR